MVEKPDLPHGSYSGGMCMSQALSVALNHKSNQTSNQEFGAIITRLINRGNLTREEAHRHLYLF